MIESDDRPGLVLASGSRVRRHLLQAAGVAFTVEPADLDEAALRAPMLSDRTQGDGRAIALMLAEEKAKDVSKAHPKALVLGADQTLSLDTEIFSKATNEAGARAALGKLRGKTHQLFAAVALAEHGEVVWSTVERADLTMRSFSDAFLDDYIARAGDAVMSSVGGYELESIGIQLFEKIDGDFFTILGLPMLAVLEELRRRGVVKI